MEKLHDSKLLAIDILKEAISRLEGNECTNIWSGIDGYDCDAIDIAIKTVQGI